MVKVFSSIFRGVFKRPGVVVGVSAAGVRVGEGGARGTEPRFGVTCGEGAGAEALGEGVGEGSGEGGAEGMWGLGGLGNPRELRGGLGVVVARGPVGIGEEFKLAARGCVGVPARVAGVDMFWPDAVRRAGGQLDGRARSWGYAVSVTLRSVRLVVEGTPCPENMLSRLFIWSCHILI